MTAPELFEGYEFIKDRNIGYSRYGDGPNYILCVCGAVGCYKKDWPLSLLKCFPPDFVTIVCIDPPGYGTSRPPDRIQEVNRCKMDAEYCLLLMKTLQFEPFTIVGWSEGARTAIHVAGQGKQAVNRMVLVAGGSKVNKLGAMAFQGMRDTDHWLPQARSPYLTHYSNEYLKIQWAALCNVVDQVYQFCGGRFPCDYVLPSIKCPSLVINGGMDRFCGDPRTNFQPVLKDLRIEVHAQGGHDFHIKYPKWFSTQLIDFIKKT
ncbi:unnamed protein product [Caenorhabditis auriculariae]|uniref:AB hydrolase-1 domain-containing protein n=1 Tax=Caenorhabditis auriculariae TaxID=2777116 RepID=A0A8S1H9A4_9PELO|nr:unnamed protein product [Caenorhabditis auriculariae]